MQAFLALTFMVAAAYSQDFSLLAVTVANSQAQEGQGKIEFTPILRNRGSEGAYFNSAATSPAFTYSTSDGSATGGVDYVAATSIPFAFSADKDNTATSITIQLVDDVIAEPNRETFLLSIASANANIKVPDPAVGTIIDDEGLTVELADAAAVEGVDTAFQFGVTLSHAVSVDFPLQLATLARIGNHFARAGIDYENLDTTLLIAPGTTSKTFSVNIIDDNIQENLETFEVQVSYTPGSATDEVDFDFVASKRSVVGTFDAETEGVTICVDNVLMAEGASDVMHFSVTISHAVGADVPVEVMTVPGSTENMGHVAVEGATGHYLYNEGTYTFTAGSQDSFVFDVTVMNDDFQSPNSMKTPDASFGPLNFGVQFSIGNDVFAGAVGGAKNFFNVVPCNSATQTGLARGEIYDFEDVTISLTSSSLTMSEKAGIDAMSFSVALSHYVLGGQGVTDARGLSFEWVDSNTATPGTGDATLSVSQPGGCAVETAYGSLSMPATGPIDLCWPADKYPKKVGNGQAANDGAVFTFAAELTTPLTTFSTQLERGPDDHIVEGSETFTVGILLDSVAQSGYSIRAADGLDVDADTNVITVTRTLLDDEPSNPFSVTNAGSIAETNGKIFSLDVSLTHSVAVDVSMSWDAIAGTAEDGTDYTKGSLPSLEFNAFSAPATARSIQINILNDDVQELDETFQVVFSDAKPANMVTFPDVVRTATITDDEGLTLTIADMTAGLDESQEQFAFDVTLSHQADFDVSVSYAASVFTGTLDAGQSKASLSRFNSTVTPMSFPAYSTVQQALIRVVNDDVQTGSVDNEARFAVTVNTASVSSIDAGNSKLVAKGLVKDNENVVVSISNAFATEGVDTFAEFTVSLSHKVSEAITITYSSEVCDIAPLCSMTNGSVTTGTNDFVSATSQSLVIPAFTESSPLQVRLNNDNVQEFQEKFSVKLISASNGYAIEPTANTSTATIYDDESVVASIGDASALEGDDLSFIVKLSHKVASDVTVFYTLNSGTAVFGEDFSIANSIEKTGSVTIPASDMGSSMRPTATIVIKADNDNIAELAETFTISLAYAVAGDNMATILLPTDTTGTGTGTIGNPNFYDEDITVAVTNVFGQDGVNRGQDARFAVVLSHAIDQKVSVSYSTSDRTASAPTDYISSVGTLVFPKNVPAAGATFVPRPLEITVPTVKNECQQLQEDKTFKVSVDTPSGFRPQMGDLSQIEKIKPFDHHPQVSIEPATANEGDNMLFTVRLSVCIAEDLHVGYNLDTNPNLTHTAYPGRDFTLPNLRFLTFDSSSKALTQTFEIPLFNNDIQGLTKNFWIKIGAANPPNDNADDYGVTFGPDTALATIIDAEDVTIAIAQYVAQRPSVDPDFKFTVTLSHAVETLLELNYQTEEITAVAETDFEPVDGVVQYTVGNKGDRVVVVTTINRPDVVQPGTTGANTPTRFGLKFTAADEAMMTRYNIRYAMGDNITPDNIAKGAIMGKNSTNVLLARTEAMEGTNAIFTATLIDEVSSPVVIGFQASGSDGVLGRANPPFDLRGVSGSFTFQPNVGSNQQTNFSIELYDDYLVEPTESFDIVLTVLEPVGFQGTVINFDGVQIGHTITDNDFATLSVTDATSNEGGDMLFSVVLSHEVYQEVIVDVTPSSTCAPGLVCIIQGSSAPAPSTDADLLVPASGMATVVFTPTIQGARVEGGSTQVVSFRVLNDDVVEPTETFLVTAVTSSPLVGADSDLTATGTIADDEGAMFIFNSPSGLEGEPMVFTVALTHAISTSFSVDFETVGVNPFVFKSKSGFFTLHPNDPTNAFEIETVDNSVLSASNVTFNVQTGAITPSVIIAQGVAVGTLINDDENAVIIVSCDPADENAATPTLKFVSTLYTATTTPLTVAYATRDIVGQAVAGEDYTAVSGSFEFAGQLLESKTVEVAVLQDNLVEEDELVGFDVSVASAEYAPLIEVVQVSGLIVDNEGAEIEIRDARVFEDDGAELMFTVFLSHKVGTNTMFSLTYNTFSGSEANAASTANSNLATGERGGKDYVAVTGASSAGFVGDRGTIKVPIFDDYIVEEQEVMQVSVTSVSDKFTLKSSIATGIIVDNDFATISIDSKYEAHEGMEEVHLTVTMSHLTQPEVQVSYKTIDGFATSSLDIDNMKNVDFLAKEGIVSFPSVFGSSDTNPRLATVSVTLVDDALVEEAFEDFSVTLRDVVSPTNVGIHIDDLHRDGFIALVNDKEAATISISDVTGNEGDTLTFVAVMSHGIQVADFDVSYETMDVTAEAGEDYTANSGTVTFASSVVEGRHAASPFIEVVTVDDANNEYNELFEVELTGINDGDDIKGIASSVPLGAATLSLESEIAFGFINDNRGELPQNQLSIEGGTANEEDGVIEFTVYYPRRTADHLDNNEKVSFSYGTFAGTALPGRDFISTEGMVEIAGDVESVVIRVPIVDNAWVQGDHSFSVVIQSKLTIIGESTATGTIIDNDSATVTIGNGVGAEMEGGTVVFPVTLSNEVASELSFNFATRGATNDIASVTSATFKMDAGMKTGEIVVFITNDDQQEDAETFSLDANGLIIFNAAIASSQVTFAADGSSAEGTITDDEHATVSVTDMEVQEDVGAMRFNLALSHEIRMKNEVTFSVVSDTAVEGTDMTSAARKSVQFPTRSEGVVPVLSNVLITIEDDSIVEGNEDFKVVIESTTTGIWLPDNSDERVAIVTIVDDDFATVSISDVTGVETQGTMNFQVTLSHEVAVSVSVEATASNIQGGINNPVMNFAAGSSNAAPIITNAGVSGSIMQPDFLLGSMTLALTKGSSEVAVPVYDDTEQECDEVFKVSLTKLLCGSIVCDKLVVLDNAVATGTLANDDEGLTLAGTVVEHSESMSPFEFTLSLSHAVDHAFEMTTSIVATDTSRSRLVDCTDMTIAQCRADTAVTTEIPAHRPNGMFQGLGAFTQTITVDVRDDIIAQAPGLFEINIAAQLSCGSIILQNARGTINDNEAASIEIMSLEALEDGDHPMTVKLSHAIEADLTVGFLVDGDAVDFATLSGDVSFTPAQAGQTAFAQIDVRAEIENIEADKAYSVALTDVPAWLINSGPATLTIIDDEIQGSFVNVRPGSTAVEGEMMTFEVFLEKDHENPLSLDYAFVGDTAVAGIDFLAYTGDLYWPVGDMSTRIIQIPTLKVAGCDSDKIVNLVLSGVTGGSALSNKEASMAISGVIFDSDGATVSVSAPAKVASGSILAVSAMLSSMCDFDVTVPVTISGAAPGQDFVAADLACTILANTDKCTINVDTLPAADAAFSVAVASTEFAARNEVFSVATVSSASATGTIAIVAAGSTIEAASSEPVAATVATGMDFAKKMSASALFSTDADAEVVTYSVVTTSGMAVATIAGDVITYSSEFIGDSVLTVTATIETGSASVTVNVAAATVEAVTMKKLAKLSPVVIQQGQYFQRLVTKVLNDPVKNGNFAACATTGNDATLNDCCVVTSGLIQNQVCERSVTLNRALRLESIRLSLYGAELGTSEVCMGSNVVADPTAYPGLTWCFMVTVVV